MQEPTLFPVQIKCTLCERDYTNSKKKGGMLFGKQLICPECKDAFMLLIKEYNEQHLIREHAFQDETFCDFAKRMIMCGTNKLN